MLLKNVLVPIDFSNCSKNALRTAIELARKRNAKIHLVNAIHVHTPHPDLTGGSIVDSIMSDYETQVKQSFEELESEVVELKDIPHETDRFMSYFTDAIQSEIASKDIDLIVMGTRASHDRIDHLFGTHATDVIQQSSVPVLVIPENCEQFQPKKIGFASDFGKVISHKCFDSLVWLAEKFESEILVFHVDDSDAAPEEVKNRIGIIEEGLKNVSHSILTVKTDSVVDGINKFVQEHQLDVLAMMPRKHSLFERVFGVSITRTMALDTKIPILTFNDQ
ncbi:MAG: universal stress protein [Cyclobacteriaceae bacterium]